LKSKQIKKTSEKISIFPAKINKNDGRILEVSRESYYL
jgi:hypothetical protein